jgi:hypothetical protein
VHPRFRRFVRVFPEKRLEQKSLKGQTKAEEEGTRGPFLLSLRLPLLKKPRDVGSQRARERAGSEVGKTRCAPRFCRSSSGSVINSAKNDDEWTDIAQKVMVPCGALWHVEHSTLTL